MTIQSQPAQSRPNLFGCIVRACIWPLKWAVIMPTLITTLVVEVFISGLWDVAVFCGFVLGLLTSWAGIGTMILVISVLGLVVSILGWFLTTALLNAIGWCYKNL